MEYPETCTLWWTDDTMSAGYNYLQTNFPTRNMRVIVTSATGDRSISLPAGFEPEKTTTIEVLLNLSGSHQIVMRYGTTSIQTLNVSSSTTRRYIYYWDPVVGAWTVTSHTQNTSAKSFAGGSSYDVPPDAPARVEDWLQKFAQNHAASP